MITCFVALVCSFSSKRFNKLAKEAQLNSKKALSKGSGPCLGPGHYDYGSLVFDLDDMLCDDISDEIKGIAHDEQYAAIIQNKNILSSTSTVYSEGKTQKLYRIGELVESENNVEIHEIDEIPPIRLFKTFKMGTLISANSSKKTDDIIQKQLQCTRDNLDKQGKQATCTGYFNVNWNESTNKPNKIEIPKNKFLTEGSSFQIGASAKTDFQVLIEKKRLGNFEVNFDGDFSLMGGLGIEIKKGNVNQQIIDILDKTQQIPLDKLGIKTNFEIKGLAIGFSLSLHEKLDIKNYNLDVPNDITIYKGIELKAHLKSRVSSNLRKINSNTYKNSQIIPIKETTLPSPDASTPTKNMKLSATPRLAVGLQLALYIGQKDSPATIEIGPRLGAELNYEFNNQKCTFPYLYGKPKLFVDAYFNIDPSKMLKFILNTITSWLYQKLKALFESYNFNIDTTISKIKALPFYNHFKEDLDGLTSKLTEWKKEMVYSLYKEDENKRKESCLMSSSVTFEGWAADDTSNTYMVWSNGITKLVSSEEEKDIPIYPIYASFYDTKENLQKDIPTYPSNVPLLLIEKNFESNDPYKSLKFIQRDKIPDNSLLQFKIKNINPTEIDVVTFPTDGIETSKDGVQNICTKIDKKHENDDLCFDIQQINGIAVGFSKEFKVEYGKDPTFITFPVTMIEQDKQYGVILNDNGKYRVTDTGFQGISSSLVLTDEKLIKKMFWEYRKTINLKIKSEKLTSSSEVQYIHAFIYRCKDDKCKLISNIFHKTEANKNEYTASDMNLDKWNIEFNVDNYPKLKFEIKSYNEKSELLFEKSITKDITNDDWLTEEGKEIDITIPECSLKIISKGVKPVPGFIRLPEEGNTEKIEELKGIVCRLYSSKENNIEVIGKPSELINIQINQKQNEIYGIIKVQYQVDESFLNELLTNSDKYPLYVLLSFEGATPLVSYEMMNEGQVYLISLTRSLYDKLNSNLLITIPFRRTSFAQINTNAKILRIFTSSGNGMCSTSTKISTMYGIETEKIIGCGCVEIFAAENSNDDVWISPYEADDKNTILDIIQSNYYETNKQWKFHGFLSKHKTQSETKTGSVTISPLSSMLIMYNEEFQKIVPEETMKVYEDYSILTNKPTVQIKCPRCTSIEVEAIDGEKQMLTNKINECFSLDPSNAKSITITPICSDNNNKNCLITEERYSSIDKYYSANYKDPAGLIDLSNDDGENSATHLAQGVSRQIIKGGKITYYKTFEGKIDYSEILAGEMTITKSKKKFDGKEYIDLSCKIGDVIVPFSIQKFRENIDVNSLSALGIDTKESSDFVWGYLDDGTLRVISVKFTQPTNTDNINASSILDLPDEYVNKITFKEDKSSKLLWWHILLIVIACIVIIIGIIKIIHCLV